MTPYSNRTLTAASLPRFRPAPFVPLSPRRATNDGRSRQQVLVAPFSDIQMSFENGGMTWLRLLPPHADSKIDSPFLEFKSYDLAPFAGNHIPEVVMPESILGYAGQLNPIEQFLTFIDANFPSLIHTPYPEGNDRGLSLWAKSRAVCIVYVHQTPSGVPKGVYRCRPWVASTYNGGVHNRQGILYRLQSMMSEKVPSPRGPSDRLRYGDISHPETGRMFAVQTRADPRAGFAYEGISISEEICPLSEIAGIFAAHPQFAQYNRPIEDVLRIPTDAELLLLLQRYIEHKILRGLVDKQMVLEAFKTCFGQPVSGSVFVVNMSGGSLPASPRPLDTPAPAPRPVKKAPVIIEDLPPLKSAPVAQTTDVTPAVAPGLVPQPSHPRNEVTMSSKEQLIEKLKRHLAGEPVENVAGICSQLAFRFLEALNQDELDILRLCRANHKA